MSITKKIILILFGIFLSLILLEIGLHIGEFIFLSLQEHGNKTTVKQKKGYVIMCLGESTTAAGGENSYPRQLEDILNKRNVGIKFKVINKGVPAVNSYTIVSNLEENLNRYNPDMVTIMMGINDQRDILHYEKIPLSKKYIPKIFKLANLLWQHSVNKVKGIEFYNTKKSDEDEIKTGWYHIDTKNHKKTEKMLLKESKTNPNNTWAYFKLGWYYTHRKEYKKAEELLKSDIRIHPDKNWSYVLLGFIYTEQTMYYKAQNMLLKAIEIDPKDYMVLKFLGLCYKKWGKYSLANEYFDKATKLQIKYYCPVTRYYFQILQDIVTKRKIKLVAIQYPVLSIELLKNMFQNTDDIIFVDNEMPFKKAIEQGSYDKYFIDSFAGDFGHCTPEGNKLLAGNIANVIIQKLFQ